MGTTAQKLSYLGETKNQLKDVINYAGAGITTDAFRQYPRKLYTSYLDILKDNGESLFNNLPHVTGQGSNITLNGTAETRMKIELNPSELEQLTTTGKNILPTQVSYWESGQYDTDGTKVASSTRMRLKELLPVEPNTTYYVGRLTILRSFNAQQQFQRSIGSVAGESTFTTGANDYYLGVTLNTAIGSYVEEEYKASLILNSVSDKTWEKYSGNQPAPNPNFPQNVHVITGDNVVKIVGENLFDESQLLNATEWSLNSSGYYTGGIAYLRAYSLTWQPTKYKENTRYTMRYISYGSSGNSNGRVTVIYTDNTSSSWSLARTTTPLDFSFTTAQNKTIAKIEVGYGSSDTIYIKDVILSDGATSIPYETYQSQTHPITLGNTEYCKIGNYSDKFFKNTADSEEYNSTLELNKWYLKKNINKIVLNGTETWTLFSSQGRYSFYTNIASGIGKNVLSDRFICNTTIGFPNIGEVVYNGDTNKNMVFRSPDETTIQNAPAFKTWLQTNNVIVYYMLETPTYTLLNDTLQTQLDNLTYALSYEEQTNINQANNDLPFNINATAIRDINNILE